MTLPILIVILVVCLLLEGFFSGTEMALVTADKYRLAIATDAGSKQALSALHMVKHPAKFFATTLLGTNLCTITASVVTAFFVIGRFGADYAPLALAYWPFTLVLGEIVPKSIFQHHADRIALRAAPILLGISMALYPLVWALSKLTDSLLGGVKRRQASSPPVTREELELMLEVGRQETSDVKPAERTMISRIFDLAEKRVKGIMTPLADVVALPADAGREEAMEALERHGFSRVPVFEGDVFNIVGVLSGSGLLFGGEGKGLKELIQRAYFVAEEMPLDELLVAMKRQGQPLAVAVDEYGAASGVVTLEDLLEEVVGEIRDEHDEPSAPFRRIGWHRYIISGRMEVEEARDRLKLPIPPGEYETVAGFVIHRMERIPKPGDSFRIENFKFTVMRATERAVIEVEAAQEP